MLDNFIGGGVYMTTNNSVTIRKKTIIISVIALIVVALGIIFYVNSHHKEYYNNGNIYYDGGYSQGKWNGTGKLYDINGNLSYEGKWKDGHRASGKEYKSGKLYYEGAFGFATGSIYTASSENDVYYGEGKIYSLETGNLIYEGTFANGRITRGKAYFADGPLLYEGTFANQINPVFDGEGKLYKDNKVVYEGDFKDGAVFVNGKYIDAVDYVKGNYVASNTVSNDVSNGSHWSKGYAASRLKYLVEQKLGSNLIEVITDPDNSPNKSTEYVYAYSIKIGSKIAYASYIIRADSDFGFQIYVDKDNVTDIDSYFDKYYKSN
jgi:hypothetical protein